MEDFALQHPWMTFGIVIFALNETGNVIRLVLRTIKVCAAGWPPAHIDADGDFQAAEVD